MMAYILVCACFFNYYFHYYCHYYFHIKFNFICNSYLISSLTEFVTLSINFVFSTFALCVLGA